MKKIIFTTFTLFLLFATQAAAHTYLDVTTPADGDIVTTDILSIELTYSGKIEEGSFFTIKNNEGTEIPVKAFTVADGKLTGQLEESLKNGIYTVNWNSISQDGHPLSGDFSFTVDKVETEQIEDVQTEVQENVENTENESEKIAPLTDDQNDEKQNSSTLLIVAGVILVVLIAISTFVLWKRKK